MYTINCHARNDVSHVERTGRHTVKVVRDVGSLTLIHEGNNESSRCRDWGPRKSLAKRLRLKKAKYAGRT